MHLFYESYIMIHKIQSLSWYTSFSVISPIFLNGKVTEKRKIVGGND